jgi:hypothetical protein
VIHIADGRIVAPEPEDLSNQEISIQ